MARTKVRGSIGLGIPKINTEAHVDDHAVALGEIGPTLAATILQLGKNRVTGPGGCIKVIGIGRTPIDTAI